MGVAIITGSAGLIGSEAVRFFSSLGMKIVGIDNDMRKFFFGEEASTKWNRLFQHSTYGKNLFPSVFPTQLKGGSWVSLHIPY